MPVVTVTAQPLSSADDELRALARVASAIAAALGLRPEDVQVTLVHAVTAVLGTSPVDAWPLVVLHGTRRETAPMAAALDGARRCVALDWARDPGEVWVQWLVVEDVAGVGA